MSDNLEILSTTDFTPLMSSNEICLGLDVTVCLTDAVNGKADINHTHSEYASSSVATTSANGLMSATDKTKLDEIVTATVSEVETYLSI